MAKVVEGVSDGSVDVGQTRVKWSVAFSVRIYRESRKRLSKVRLLPRKEE